MYLAENVPVAICTPRTLTVRAKPVSATIAPTIAASTVVAVEAEYVQYEGRSTVRSSGRRHRRGAPRGSRRGAAAPRGSPSGAGAAGRRRSRSSCRSDAARLPGSRPGASIDAPCAQRRPVEHRSRRFVLLDDAGAGDAGIGVPSSIRGRSTRRRGAQGRHPRRRLRRRRRRAQARRPTRTSCSSTSTTTTRSSRCCTSSRPACSSPAPSGTRCATSSTGRQRRRPSDDRDRDRPRAREVRFEEMEPLTYDYLVLALGAEVNFFGTEGAAEHAFPMYTLADAVRLKEHVLQRWEAADRDPALVDDGALNIVVVGGGPTGVETAGALAELYRSIFVKDYPNLPQDNAESSSSRPGRSSSRCSSRTSATYTEKALEKRGVELIHGEAVASIAPTRVTLKSGTVLKAHTLVWGAGLQGNPIAQSLGIELQRGNRIAVGPDLSLPEHPEVYAVGDIAAITDPKTNRCSPSSARSRCRPESTPARTSPGASRARRPSRSGTTTRARWRRSDVAPRSIQMPRGRTMKGRTASLAWGTVHLALLSTGEDRAKAIVDWTWAGITHERPGRITVRTDRRRAMTATTAFSTSSAGTGRAGKEATGTVRFELEDGGDTERWRESKGRHGVRGRTRQPTAWSAPRELFDGVVDGEMSAVATLLRGAMAVEGIGSYRQQFGTAEHDTEATRPLELDGREREERRNDDERRPRWRAPGAGWRGTPGRAGRLRGLRDHRRPREGDDVPLAVPAGEARAPRLPDRRGCVRRLDGRAARERARESIVGTGEQLDKVSSTASRPGSPTCRATSRTPRRTAASPTRSRARAAGLLPRDPAVPLRPGRQGPRRRRADEDRARRRGEAVRPRSGLGPRAGRRAAPVHRRVAALPDRPLPREDGPRGDPLPPVREHDARAGLEPELRLVRADHDGGGLRGRGSRALLRSRRRAARRRGQPPHAGGRGRRMEPPAGRDPQALKDAKVALFRAIEAADPAHYVRGQYDGYRDIDGVAADSTTETYAALRLDIESWRWSGVPFFIRTGKRLPITQTELRLVFKHPPKLGFKAFDRRPEPNQFVIKLDPSTGIRLIVDAHRGDVRRPSRSISTWSSPRREARARHRTRCCSTPRWWARARGSRARTASRRRGGSCSRCSTRRRPSTRMRPGTWGPRGRGQLVAGHGRWHGPWVAS